MKRCHKLLIIVVALLVEFAWIAAPRYGSWGPGKDRYRREQRMAAWQESAEHTSPATKAAYESELARLDVYNERRRLLECFLVLLLNGGFIYWFWRYGARTRAA
jgi:hypothetical protein